MGRQSASDIEVWKDISVLSGARKHHKGWHFERI